ncbi:MAG: glycosyltransferase family 4 protein [Epsilonproteobacteria bacterium]|nr:glycosyltransferase family 4 protein [Campylobacterota bacterium]
MEIAFLSHLDLNLYRFRMPIMRKLIQLGHKVYAIVPSGDVSHKFVDEGIVHVDYNIDRSSLNPFKELQTIHQLRHIVHKLNPDILHSFMHKPNLYANLTFSKNTINTITGLGSFFIYDDIKSTLIRNIIIQGYKYSSKHTKKIVLQNQDDYEYFSKILPSHKLALIKSSGIDLQAFHPIAKNTQLLRQLGIKDKVVVLMVGRVIKDKGVREYIQAANMLQDKAVFLYAGFIDKGNKNHFTPNWGAVRYLGFREDIKQLLSISDIFVLPSYKEGVPMTLLEAGAMQKAIVTTNTSGCKDVVDDGINGFLVDVKDTQTLAHKIDILIHNPSLRARFGYNIRQKMQEFDINHVVEQYLQLYRDIT